jgi:hypothetical protein
MYELYNVYMSGSVTTSDRDTQVQQYYTGWLLPPYTYILSIKELQTLVSFLSQGVATDEFSGLMYKLEKTLDASLAALEGSDIIAQPFNRTICNKIHSYYDRAPQHGGDRNVHHNKTDQNFHCGSSGTEGMDGPGGSRSVKMLHLGYHRADNGAFCSDSNYDRTLCFNHKGSTNYDRTGHFDDC